MKRRPHPAAPVPPSPRAPSSHYIHPHATIIGDVKLGKSVSIWPGAVLRGDFQPIKIGNYTNIQDNVVIHGGHKHSVEIGDYVSIGHGAIVHGCKIGNYVLVGMGAIILNGAEIPDNCFIGAGALVSENKKLEPGVYVGVPAKKMRDMHAGDHEYIRKNALDYWGNAKEVLGKKFKNYKKKGL